MKLISAKRPMKPVARGGANRDDVILVVCCPRSRGPVVRETGAHSSARSSLIHGRHSGNMAGRLPVASVHRKCDECAASVYSNITRVFWCGGAAAGGDA